MKELPLRQSLVSQTARVLREAIAIGEWQGVLPGEIPLCERLRVSRGTLRAALEQLEREKVIRSGQGRRRQIMASAGSGTNAPNPKVVLLSPVPIQRLDASTMVWVDELRERLAVEGRSLEVQESAAAYRQRPARALEELAARLRPAGWVLYRSTPEMQRWFDGQGLPAVIAGSRHERVRLASVDVDYAAACRHAAGCLTAAGHRRLAVIRPDTRLAGDLESVAGFAAGAGEAVVQEVAHDGTVHGVVRGLSRLFAGSSAPTGLLVFHAVHCLTVLGWLHQQGYRVPRDVSVMCRDDEPFLEAMLPLPTRYAVPARLFARKVSAVVAALVGGHASRVCSHRLIPALLRGQTVAAAPV